MDEQTRFVVGITGHRPKKLGGYDDYAPINLRIKSEIKDTLSFLCPGVLITGMALGVDTWAAEICLDLGIPFIAAVPFAGQEKLWPDPSQQRYRNLLNQAEEVVYVSKGKYAAWKMHKRNEWIVWHAQLMLAVWDGSEGGTGSCVRHIRKLGKDMVQINPLMFME